MRAMYLRAATLMLLDRDGKCWQVAGCIDPEGIRCVVMPISLSFNETRRAEVTKRATELLTPMLKLSLDLDAQDENPRLVAVGPSGLIS